MSDYYVDLALRAFLFVVGVVAFGLAPFILISALTAEDKNDD